MRICFFTHNLDTRNGEGRFSYDLITHLKNQSKEVVALTIVAPNTSLQFEAFNLLENPWLNFFNIRSVLRTSDIIHAIDIWPCGFYAHLISFGLQKPIIITALGTHSVAPLYSRLKPFLTWAYKKSKIITAISDYTVQKIKKALPALDVKVIFPGFDLDFWSRKSAYAENKKILGLKPYILSVGALKARKGYHLSLEAFVTLSRKFERLNYVIIGQEQDSYYTEKLRKTIKENGLESRVFFFNHILDDQMLLGFYNNAEVFVLTPVEESGRFEGFGLVYLEAAASKLPVVATRDSGAQSAVSDQHNGILVPPDNPRHIASAVLEILTDSSFRSKLGENGRQWVNNFSWQKIIQQYSKIYEEINNH